MAEIIRVTTLDPSNNQALHASGQGGVRRFSRAHLLPRARDYARTVRAAVFTPLGLVTYIIGALAYMGLYLWLGGMLLYNSKLNYHGIPMINYDLTPSVGQPYLIFVPDADVLLFVNVTAAASTLVLGGLFGLSLALFVYSMRHLRMGRTNSKGGAGLTIAALPTLVPYLGLGCCGTPAFPLLVGLLPASVAGFAFRLGLRYELMIGAVTFLMLASIFFTLMRIRRTEACGPASPQPDGSV